MFFSFYFPPVFQGIQLKLSFILMLTHRYMVKVQVLELCELKGLYFYYHLKIKSGSWITEAGHV